MEKIIVDFKNVKKKFHYCHNNKICSVEGCNNPVFCKGYCAKHYAQIQNYGKIINTIYDKNEIIEHEDYAEIIVRKKDGTIKGKAIIDLDDIEKCRRFKWGMYSNGYFYGNINKVLRIRLHRYILGLEAFDRTNEVDHINRDKSDNRKCNLRITTHSENNKNKDRCYAKVVNTDNDNIYFDKRRNQFYGRYGYRGATYTTKYYKNRENALNEMNKIKQKLIKDDDRITFVIK